MYSESMNLSCMSERVTLLRCRRLVYIYIYIYIVIPNSKKKLTERRVQKNGIFSRDTMAKGIVFMHDNVLTR